LKQTAELLQISYDQLWLMVKNSEPHPPYFLIGKRKRFIREQVLEWAKEQTSGLLRQAL
jgi:predicted DNA-binding transcriptional regulator AlpA